MLPLLQTDEPLCPEGQLACGSGDCIDSYLFCDGQPDCADKSDENACGEWHRPHMWEGRFSVKGK